MPFPPAGDLLDPEIEPESFTSPALASRFFTKNATWEALGYSPPLKKNPVCLSLERLSELTMNAFSLLQ